MGFPNLNLNTKEIITAFESFDVPGGKVGLWRYQRRRSPSSPKPALIYFHGGAWIGGSTTTVENQLKLIAELSGAVVFNVDYSLAPEKPYPQALNDCYFAVTHIHDSAACYGVDPMRIAVGGDSAGGNLAAAAALKARDQGERLIREQILLYPALALGGAKREGYRWIDYSSQVDPRHYEDVKYFLSLGNPAETIPNSYLSDPAQENDPYVSPILAESFTALPEALIVTAEFDGLRSQANFYAKLLKDDGVPVRVLHYKGCCHAFFDYLGYVPQVEELCSKIAEELNGY
jgi:acetyl esterase/lipase